MVIWGTQTIQWANVSKSSRFEIKHFAACTWSYAILYAQLHTLLVKGEIAPCHYGHATQTEIQNKHGKQLRDNDCTNKWTYLREVSAEQ